MTLTDTAVSIIALAAAGVALLALLMVFALGRRLRRLRRLRPRAPQADAAQQDPNVWDASAVAYELAELREGVGHAVQRVGLVRFDAFEDMGGQLSFAVALLDAAGDGVVLSSINGRSETRVYAKQVERGSSRHNLSGEEEEAIRRALGAVRR